MINWLDEDISPVDTPNGVIIKLCGIYNPNTHYTTVYLIVDYRGTEYKITRYHMQTTRGPDPNVLKHRYSLMVQSFIRKYSHIPFADLTEKFLDWSDNPAHEILRALIPPRELADI